MIETAHLSKLYSRGVYALRDLTLTIEDDGAGAAALRDIEGLLHDARDVVDVRNEIAVLHDGQGDADHAQVPRQHGHADEEIRGH